MNPSNWWGVLYGVLTCLTISAATCVLFAFALHRTPMADSRTWNTDDDPDWPNTIDDLIRDLDRQPKDPA